jgi:hypothetical protein
MATNSRTGKTIDDDMDALFQLPLSEFIGARTALAARLKKEKRAAEADRVKSIGKPSISVWAVNQLYWHHRDQFERLISAGQRFRKAQATTRIGKAADLNEALDARREALNHLSELATTLLRDAGHNPALDTMRRIAATLEALSANATLPDRQAAGRLTVDLDPPGFESLAPFIRAVPMTRPEPPALASGRKLRTTTSVNPANKSAGAPTKTRQTSAAIKEPRRVDDTRQAKLNAAKASLQGAKKSLVGARARAHTLEAEKKKAERAAKDAEKQKHKAEARFKEASAASVAAAVRAENLARETERAAKTLEDAERAVEQASNELESLFREAP